MLVKTFFFFCFHVYQNFYLLFYSKAQKKKLWKILDIGSCICDAVLDGEWMKSTSHVRTCIWHEIKYCIMRWWVSNQNMIVATGCYTVFYKKIVLWKILAYHIILRCVWILWNFNWTGEIWILMWVENGKFSGVLE